MFLFSTLFSIERGVCPLDRHHLEGWSLVSFILKPSLSRTVCTYSKHPLLAGRTQRGGGDEELPRVSQLALWWRFPKVLSLTCLAGTASTIQCHRLRHLCPPLLPCLLPVLVFLCLKMESHSLAQAGFDELKISLLQPYKMLRL